MLCNLKSNIEGAQASQRTAERDSAAPNIFVRVYAGAYRATNTKVLENELRSMPIDIYMEGQVINTDRENKPKVDGVIIDASRRIRDHLKGRRGRITLVRNTPRQAKLEGTKKVLADHQPELNQNRQFKDPNGIAARLYQGERRKKRRKKFRENRTPGQPADLASNDDKVLFLSTSFSAAHATVCTLPHRKDLVEDL